MDGALWFRHASPTVSSVIERTTVCEGILPVEGPCSQKGQPNLPVLHGTKQHLCPHLALQTVVVNNDQAQHKLQCYDKHDPSGEPYTVSFLFLSFLRFLDTLRWSWVQGPVLSDILGSSMLLKHRKFLLLWYDIVMCKPHAAELQNKCPKSYCLFFFFFFKFMSSCFVAYNGINLRVVSMHLSEECVFLIC